MKEEYTIITDSREQDLLWKTGTIIKKLDTGDYSFIYEDKDYSNIFSCERKSISDLIGTLTRGNARFKKELIRSQQLKFFCIIVDESYYNLRTLKFKGSKYLQKRTLTYTVSTVRKIVQTLRVKYGVQIIFCDSRTEEKLIIKELIEAYIRTYCKRTNGHIKQSVREEEK